MKRNPTIVLSELIELQKLYKACLPNRAEEAKEVHKKRAQVLDFEVQITEFIESYKEDSKLEEKSIPIDQALARNYVQACVEHVGLLDSSKKATFLESASNFLSAFPHVRTEKEKKVEITESVATKKDKSGMGLVQPETKKPKNLVAVYKTLVEEGERIRQKFQNPDQHHRLEKFGIFADSKNAVKAMAFDLITRKEYQAPPISEIPQIKDDFKLAVKLQKQEIAGLFAKKSPRGDFELAKKMQAEINSTLSKKI